MNGQIGCCIYLDLFNLTYLYLFDLFIHSFDRIFECVDASVSVLDDGVMSVLV